MLFRKDITNDVLANYPTSDTPEATLDFPLSENKDTINCFQKQTLSKKFMIPTAF
jgi:hypothetical protein